MRVGLTICALSSLMLITSCAEKINEQHREEKTDSSAVDKIEELIKESQNYLEDRDFDGDGMPDAVFFNYSGGAHCCYSMSLKLSTLPDTLHYPFEMDGGYGFGIVDGSQADQFCVADVDEDSLPEIFMTISTYNGIKDPIEPDWTKTYGITSNYIVFDFWKGKIRLIDYDSSFHVLPLKK